jgi:folate-binding protein YgfZ
MTAAELYAAAMTTGAVADLSTRARWQLAGADRVRYLNGQATRDIRKLPAGTSSLACVLDVKGRLCGDVWVSAAADFLRIDADADVRESLGARLERYIIADDAVLEDVTETTGQLHVFAPEGVEIGALVSAPGEWLQSARFGPRGYDFFGTMAEVQQLLVELRKTMPLLAGDVLESLRIEHGVPRWNFELKPDTLPAEAGLDATAIDFAKGCYLGQEIVSRIRSVGHVNRQLTGFVATDGEPLAPGTALFASAEAEREAATITSAAWSFALSRPVALGYLRRGTAGPVLHTRADDQPARAVEIRPLPFVP